MPRIPTKQTPDPRRTKFKMPHQFNVRNQVQDTRYQSKAWRKARRVYLSHHPVCKYCGKLAAVVDHILPVRHGGGFWDSDNWQPLCKRCHDRKSGAERHWKSDDTQADG